MSDTEYIAIAKRTPEGELFFKTYDAPCHVIRVFSVQVNCDIVPTGARSTEKFRVYIDPRTNKVIDIETQFTPKVEFESR